MSQTTLTQPVLQLGSDMLLDSDTDYEKRLTPTDDTDNIAIMATVDHISNGGLCGNNHGLNNYGGRIAYTF